MEKAYNGTLVMPKNFVVVDEEEMTYVDGGIGLFEFICLCAAAGLTTMEIGEQCGAYAYNHGYARDGYAKQVFDSVIYSNPAFWSTAFWFEIGYDNGWVAASKA